MANVIAPFGLREFRMFDGPSPTMGYETLNICSTDANTLFTGDPCITNPSTSATYLPYITAATTQTNGGTNQIRGVFVGCKYYNTTVGRTVWSAYWPGGTQGSDAQANVITDPKRLFIGQLSTQTGAVLASTSIGMNIGFTNTSTGGNTTTGISNIALASSQVATGSSLPFRIVDLLSNYSSWSGTTGFVNGSDNTTIGQILVVAFNNTDQQTGTGI